MNVNMPILKTGFFGKSAHNHCIIIINKFTFRAIRHFKSALEEDPNNDRLYYNLGTAYLQKGDLKNAEKFLKRSLQTKESDLKEKAYSNLGDVYYKSKKYNQALKAYREALKINPESLITKKKYELSIKKQKQQQKKKQQQKQQQKNRNQKKKQKKNKQDQNKQQKQNQQKQKQQPNPQKIDKKTAEQILKALRQKEKENQKKARKAKGARVRVKKDW